MPETFALVRKLVLAVWDLEEVPTEWETGLLAILPKQGDRSLAGQLEHVLQGQGSSRNPELCGRAGVPGGCGASGSGWGGAPVPPVARVVSGLRRRYVALASQLIELGGAQCVLY